MNDNITTIMLNIPIQMNNLRQIKRGINGYPDIHKYHHPATRYSRHVWTIYIHIYIFSPNINKQKVDGETFFRETTILR